MRLDLPGRLPVALARRSVFRYIVLLSLPSACVRADGSSIFQIGKPVPVKFTLTGGSAGITNLVARLVISKVSNSVRGTVDDVSDEDGEDVDMLFKFRKAKGLYAYRWKTRGEAQGTYRLRADLGDGVAHEVDVSLRAAHR